MTHNAAHVLLNALKTPLKAGSKFKLYQAVIVFGLACFVAGAVIF